MSLNVQRVLPTASARFAPVRENLDRPESYATVKRSMGIGRA